MDRKPRPSRLRRSGPNLRCFVRQTLPSPGFSAGNPRGGLLLRRDKAFQPCAAGIPVAHRHHNSIEQPPKQLHNQLFLFNYIKNHGQATQQGKWGHRASHAIAHCIWQFAHIGSAHRNRIALHYARALLREMRKSHAEAPDLRSHRRTLRDPNRERAARQRPGQRPNQHRDHQPRRRHQPALRRPPANSPAARPTKPARAHLTPAKKSRPQPRTALLCLGKEENVLRKPSLRCVVACYPQIVYTCSYFVLIGCITAWRKLPTSNGPMRRGTR